jgi:signal transduction histidine kinase
LIQKNAGDSATVARLARSQERDLRAWLFETGTEDGGTLVAALRGIVREIEDTYGVDVELVSVGDCDLDDTLAPVVAAAREATVNAAKHARSPVVDLYSEVGGSAVEVFVRDRGTGFDPDSIPADRQGVRNSIVDRMARHGGTAEIRSTPGAGTDVRLKMPFQARQETTS